MRATDLLGGHLDDVLRARFLPILPEDVTVRVLPRWIGSFASWVAAITLPWGIYIRRDVLEGDPERLARLIVHELVHSRQWRVHGSLGFLRRYLGDYLRGRLRSLSHREAYRQIGLEAEAARIAGI